MFEPLLDQAGSSEAGQLAAVRAWCQYQQAWTEPRHIAVLKYKIKSEVYRLTGVGAHGTAVIAKKCLNAKAAIERLIYTQFLPLVQAPALQLYGSLADADGRFTWLFLQEATGEHYSPFSAEHRAIAGHWLATIHRAAVDTNLCTQLPDLGPSHYLELLRLGRAKLRQHVTNPALRPGDAELLAAAADQCDLVEAHWGEVEECCEQMPRVVAHDDFAAKNVRIRHDADGPALLVFDWEHAGWGLPAIDLAVGELTVSPDLDSYAAVMRRDFPGLTVEQVQRWEGYGRILRLIDSIYWDSSRLVFKSYEWLERPLCTMRIYFEGMDDALRALRWMI